MRLRYAQIAFASLIAVAGCSSSDVGERVGSNAAAVLAGTVSLPGSNFEIDVDANLKVDNAGALDWANVTEIRKADTPSGPNDESFGQGTKEDTASPTVVTGGIPPNKSDLKFFGVYQEGNTTSGFLNLFWSRVQAPSGTTNMDFEFNQRQCTPSTPLQPPTDPDCTANGLTPIRTTGDLLITYDLAQGGTKPILSERTWTGSVWGPAIDLTGSATAAGSVNTTTIPAAQSDGLGQQDPFTFGEAQIAMSAIFNPNVCESFGSAYLKSRSSDSFTAALKDFVPPVPVSISNCGTVNIHKVDNNGTALKGAVFTLFTDVAPLDGPPPHSGSDAPVVPSNTCTTDTSGNCSLVNILFGQYWVVETTTPTGFQTAPDQNVIITAAASTVNLTFVDNANPASLQIHKADDLGNPLVNAVFTLFIDDPPVGAPRQAAPADHTVATCLNGGVLVPCSCTTNGSGNCSILNITPGSYWVVETTTPPGYFTAPDQPVTLAAGDSTLLPTFTDPRKFHTIVIVCQDASGDGTGPSTLHASGVTVDGVLKTSISSSGTLDQTTLCGLGGARYTDAHLGSNYTTLNVSIP
jgi:hypothetical protein